MGFLYTVAVIILVLIIVFLVYRLLVQKVSKPKKPIVSKAKGIDKYSVILIAIALAVVAFLAVVFVSLFTYYN
jgi:hypothetical protein